VEVTKVAGVDNGDELAAFDPESWLKVCTCGNKSSFCWLSFFFFISIKSLDFSSKIFIDSICNK